MIERINLILRAKNITARQFAEEIGIQPSGMSHILGGRNNPSLDFVQKVIRRYPEIDANWLLLGRGEMYGTEGSSPSQTTSTKVPSEEKMEPPFPAQPQQLSLLPDEFADAPLPSPKADINTIPTAEPHPTPVMEPEEAPLPNAIPNGAPLHHTLNINQLPTDRNTFTPPAPISRDERRLMRVILIYSDNTFADFKPQEQ